MFDLKNIRVGDTVLNRYGKQHAVVAVENIEGELIERRAGFDVREADSNMLKFVSVEVWIESGWIRLKDYQPNSLWQHHSGRVYQLDFITNLGSADHHKFPVTCVYTNTANQTVWSRPLSEFAIKFIPVAKSTTT